MTTKKESFKEAGLEKSPFPENPVNNQLFFSYPYLFLWREEDQMWFPLPTDEAGEAELSNLNLFVAHDYQQYDTSKSDLDELAEDLNIYLKGVVTKRTISNICDFITKSTLQNALEHQGEK